MRPSKMPTSQFYLYRWIFIDEIIEQSWGVVSVIRAMSLWWVLLEVLMKLNLFMVDPMIDFDDSKILSINNTNHVFQEWM